MQNPLVVMNRWMFVRGSGGQSETRQRTGPRSWQVEEANDVNDGELEGVAKHLRKVAGRKVMR